MTDIGESIPLAEAGSVALEFGALARLTDNSRLELLADRTLLAIRRLPALHGLYPSRLRPRTGGPASREVGFGSGSDSFCASTPLALLHVPACDLHPHRGPLLQ